MKSFDVTSKGIREIIRDRRGFALLVGFPLILVVFFSFAFGSGSFVSGGSIPYKIGVFNNDAGVTLTANSTTKYVNYGTTFTQALQNATAENSTKHLFQLNNVSEDKANNLLLSRDIDALIIIPQNFSSAFATMVNNSTRTAITSTVGQQSIANSSTLASRIAASTVAQTPVFDPNTGTYITPTAAPSVVLPGANVKLPKAGNASSTLFIKGDTSSINFASAERAVSEIFDRYKKDVQANTTARATSGAGSNLYSDNIPFEMLPIAGTESFTRFDYLMPGLIVFALLLQVGQVASTLARDVETGLLDRLKLSKIRAFDLLFGTFLTWTLVTIGQVLLFIGIAIVLGYHYQGGVGSLGLAVLIGAIAGMASISLALLIASFSKRSMQALILGVMFATPFGFLAGAWLPLPRQVLGEFGGQTFQVYDLLPWTHAVNALRSVVTFGTGLSADVIFQMTWLIILTAMLFVVGVVTYSLARLRAEK